MVLKFDNGEWLLNVHFNKRFIYILSLKVIYSSQNNYLTKSVIYTQVLTCPIVDKCFGLPQTTRHNFVNFQKDPLPFCKNPNDKKREKVLNVMKHHWIPPTKALVFRNNQSTELINPDRKIFTDQPLWLRGKHVS